MYAGWVNMTDPHEVMAFDRCQWDEKHDGMETQHDYTPDKRDTQMRPFTLHAVIESNQDEEIPKCTHGFTCIKSD